MSYIKMKASSVAKLARDKILQIEKYWEEEEYSEFKEERSKLKWWEKLLESKFSGMYFPRTTYGRQHNELKKLLFAAEIFPIADMWVSADDVYYLNN